MNHLAAEPRIRANPEIRRRQILDEAVALIGQYGFDPARKQ